MSTYDRPLRGSRSGGILDENKKGTSADFDAAGSSSPGAIFRRSMARVVPCPNTIRASARRVTAYLPLTLGLPVSSAEPFTHVYGRSRGGQALANDVAKFDDAFEGRG